jgi:WD40 repeat protein/serine/threonine protein kinase
MTPEPTPPLEEQCAALLAACDDALAVGAATDPADAPDAVRPRLQRGLACLRLLEQFWPRRPAEAPADGPPAELDRFRIVRELGRGGFGIVYLAHDPLLGRDVALKVPRTNALLDPEARGRFLREARAAAALDHPNVVPVHEAGEAGPVCYLVSAYCPGTSLAAWLKSQPALIPERTAAALVATLAEAVQHAHARGVVHRDLKPANVLLHNKSEIRNSKFETNSNPEIRKKPETANPGPGGEGPRLGIGNSGFIVSNFGFRISDFEPKITDFGLAKVLGDPTEAAGTQSGAIVGTPCYMAPEQAAGKARTVGPLADIYALGAILYELLTGRPPFQGETVLETLLQVQSAEPVPPSRLRPRLRRDLETVCLKCLEKDPARRYASAAALADDLRRFLEGRPVLARPVSALQRAWRWCRRNPLPAALAGAVAVSLLAGTAVAWFFAVQADARARDALGAEEKARQQAAAALEAKRTSDRRLYISDLRLCQRAWDEGRIDGLRELLDGQRPERTDGLDLRGFEYHYWWRLAHSERLSVEGYTEGLGGLAYSPDGRRIATEGLRGRVWDVESGREAVRLEGGRYDATCLVFSPDGRRLAGICTYRDVPAAEQGSEVKVWDATTGREEHRFPRGPGQFLRVAFSPDGGRVLACFRAGRQNPSVAEVTAWELTTGRETVLRAGLIGVKGPIYSVAFSPDGTRLACGDSDPGRVWDLGTDRQPLLLGGAGFVGGVAFSPDGTRLAASGGDHTVRVWDAQTGREVQVLRGNTEAIAAVAFRPDGKQVASAGADHTVRVWDVATGREAYALRGHSRGVVRVAFSPDGRFLASLGADRTLKVWDAAPQEAVLVTEHPRGALAVAFSPDGQRLASGGLDQMVKVCDIRTGRETLALKGHTGAVISVAFSPDGRRLASGGRDRTVRVWDLAAGREVICFQGHADAVSAAAFSPDGKRIVSASLGTTATVRVWDAATGQELAPTPPAAARSPMAFSPDGRYLASGVHGAFTVLVWEAATGRPVVTLPERKSTVPGLDFSAVNCLAFSPDGKFLASGGNSRMVRLWDLSTGQEVLTLKGHTDRVVALAFHPGGTRLASGGWDRTVRLWELATGQEVLTLKGHAFDVVRVAFSPDGARLASASRDGTVKVWDATPRDNGPGPAVQGAEP